MPYSCSTSRCILQSCVTLKCLLTPTVRRRKSLCIWRWFAEIPLDFRGAGAYLGPPPPPPAPRFPYRNPTKSTAAGHTTVGVTLWVFVLFQSYMLYSSVVFAKHENIIDFVALIRFGEISYTHFLVPTWLQKRLVEDFWKVRVGRRTCFHLRH